MSTNTSQSRSGFRHPLWKTLFVCACLFELCGCSLFVMAGKMLHGDPLAPDDFKGWYGESMADTGKQVAVLCTTPDSIKSEDTALDVNLLSEVSRRMAVQEIQVIKPHRVAEWIDDHGGGNPDLKELAQGLNADFIIQIRLERFSYTEERSPNMFRGRASGTITVHEAVRAGEKDKKSKKTAAKKSKSSKPEDDPKREPVTGVRQVYVRNLNSVYPTHQPVSIEQMQLDMFRKKYLDRVSDEIAVLFYSHRPGTEF